MIYLDYNATAPMKPAVRAAMVEAMERSGNPSSVHRYGRTARRAVEEARAQIASLVGADPSQVIFTSGGTEANNLALHRPQIQSLLTSSIEHASVLAATPEAKRLPVTPDGLVDLAAAARMMAEAPKPSLVAVMAVNNETGAIQPIAELARLAASHGHLFHTDAVQAVGRLPLNFKELGVTSLSLSAHKLGGPQGMGALIVREESLPAPLAIGGGQEKGRRAGTENVPGIVGLGMAAQLAADDLREAPRLLRLRDALQQSLKTLGGADVTCFSGAVPRVANTLLVGLRGVSAEAQVIAMDLAGVAVSAGAACSSGKVSLSPTLSAMGYGQEWAGSALRFSLGWATVETDIERAVKAWHLMFDRHQKPVRSFEAA